MHEMDHIEKQNDLTYVKEARESTLSSNMMKRSAPDNRSADKASQECPKKRRAVNQEVECNDGHDEGDKLSRKLVCRPGISEDEAQSNNESNNPSVESIQTTDYWMSSIKDNDERAERLVSVPEFTFDPIKLRRELARMIVMHEYPLSVVDHIGFTEFLQNVNPLFRMANQKTVENDIMKIFRFEKCIADGELSGFNSGRVSVTTKMWTSSDGCRRFLAVTGHIIDEEWKKQSYIMRFANVPLPCTNESISKLILDGISEFDIKGKLSTITVDSYTSDDELLDILVDKLSGNKFIFNGKLSQLPCFARTLSLMVQDGFDVIKHVIEKIRASIMFWTASPQREKKFEKATCKLGVSTTAKLVLDDGFSWSSTYLMLQESFKFRDVFSHFRQQESCPGKEEWDLAKEVCNRLQILHHIVPQLIEVPTCMFFMFICEIKVKLSEWLNCEVPAIKGMALKMVEKFDKYWFAARDILGVATAFHPKYPLIPLEYFFPKIYGNEAEGEIERIRQMLKELFIEYKHSLPVNDPNDEELRSRLSPLEYRYRLHVREKKKKEPVLREFDSYLDGCYDLDTEDSEILSWWKNHKGTFPALYNMAKDILAIPIFSVDAENVFDVGDRILGANRSKLHPTMVETLMCAQSWVRNRKRSECAASSTALNLNSLGTIYDDANLEHGICLTAKSAKEGAE